MEEKLGTVDFMRIHKSFVVATKKIEFVRNQRIFIGKHIIPISDNFKDDVAKGIEGFFISPLYLACSSLKSADKSQKPMSEATDPHLCGVYSFDCITDFSS